MTRKLPMLFAAVAAIFAVSLLQAQDCKCPGKKKTNAGNCELCAMAAGDMAAAELAGVKDGHCEDCPGCLQGSCPSCPACAVQSACLDTHVNAACGSNFSGSNQALTGAFGKLPGATSFIQEQSAECASQRQQLAIQLAEYLASGNHDPAHIREVLQMALESAADSAHRQAMMNHGHSNQPLAAAPASPLNQNEPATFYHQDDIQYFPKGPEFNVSSREPEEIGQPSTPVIDSERKSSMELRQMQRDQKAMQEMITTIQKDMQRIAQDLSQLHVESRMQTRPTSTANTWQPGTNRNTQWRSVPNPAFQSTPPVNLQSSQTEYLEFLQREVESLRKQLHHLNKQTEFRPARVQQADFQQAMSLQPRRSTEMALTPARMAPVTVNYYVGDLMQPPFHTATLRLMQFLKANVDPDSWTDSHMMQIADPSISLAITQSRANHDRIAELLRQIRIGARSYMARPMR